MLRGVSWTVLSGVTAALLQVLVLAVSARVLTKEELGLISISAAFLAISHVLVEFGAGSFIIYKKGLTRAQLNSLLCISTGVSLLVFLVVNSSRSLLGDFFGNQHLEGLLFIYSVLFLLSPYNSQFQSLHIKRQALGVVAKVDVLSRLIGSATSIYLLLTGFGVASIPSGMITTNVVKILTLYVLLPGEEKMFQGDGFDWGIAKEAITYCSYIIGSQLLNVSRKYLDTLIIGKSFDLSTLGVYSLAKDFVEKISQMLGPIYNKIILPVLAKYNDDKKNLKVAFVGGFVSILSVNSLIYGSVAISSWLIVNVLYGDSEEEVIRIMSLAALFFLVRSISLVNGLYVQAIGKTHRDFTWNLVATILLPGILIVLSQLGLENMLMGMIVMQLVLLSVSFIFYHWNDGVISIKGYIVPVVIAFILTMLNYIFWVDVVAVASTVFVVTFLADALLMFQLMGCAYLFFGCRRGIRRISKVYTA